MRGTLKLIIAATGIALSSGAAAAPPPFVCAVVGQWGMPQQVVVFNLLDRPADFILEIKLTGDRPRVSKSPYNFGQLVFPSTVKYLKPSRPIGSYRPYTTQTVGREYASCTAQPYINHDGPGETIH